ncbi:MAG TPA: PLP-dependent aminotransferase family protein [Vicinamibacterales bacterium]|nr:PLP-dependent aminotransferase family protein [Vicinamibacterales bacterium]
MTMWLPNLDTRKGPVYRAIADAIDDDVQRGALRAGARLPPHRDLADHLGVTVTTITRAYAEASRRGLISGHVGRGTFIRGAEPEESEYEPGVLDLSINILMPDKEVAHLEAHLFQRRILPWTQLLGYAPKRGHLRHRQAMAAWLAQLGTQADPDTIVLTAGAQHGLATTLAALVGPGDVVLTEELTYSGVRLIAQQMRLKLRGVAVDNEGLRPDALEVACRSTRARVLYCMPRMQNPLSTVMSEKRRRQIAAIAEKYRLMIVEDDTYGFLSPERTPLRPLLPQSTVYVTSLSKSLFPGLRLGCVVAPAPLVEKITRAVWATMISTSPIGADLLCGWIEDGTAARIAAWKRSEGAARQMMARRLLAGERVQSHPTSHHMWLSLPARWSSDAFVAQVRARGVVLNASSEFAVGEQAPRAVRLCLGTPRTRAGLEQALTRVVECLIDRAPAARAVV